MCIITLEGKIGSIKNKWFRKISMHFIKSFFWMKNTQHFCLFCGIVHHKKYFTFLSDTAIQIVLIQIWNENQYSVLLVVIALDRLTLMTAWYFQHWSIHATIEWNPRQNDSYQFSQSFKNSKFFNNKKFRCKLYWGWEWWIETCANDQPFWKKKSSQVSNECIEATIKLFRPNKSFGICICTNLCYWVSLM